MDNEEVIQCVIMDRPRNAIKVLHVVPSLAMHTGGPAINVVSLARALQFLGNQVAIYTTNLATPARARRVRAGVREQELPTGVADLDVRLYPVRHPFRLAYSPGLRRALGKDVRQFDVVHIHTLNLYPQYSAWRVASRVGIPYLVSPHGALDPWILAQRRVLKSAVNSLWQRRMLSGAAALHLMTEDERHLVTDLRIGAPHRVVPNGVSSQYFEDLPPSTVFRQGWLDGFDGPLIVNHGRLTAKKGLDILIEAMVKVRIAHPEARLVLIGPDDEGWAARLRSLAARHGIADAVMFIEPLTGAPLLSALAAADVWVLPSHSDAMATAMMEAMAAGRPVVTSPYVNIPSEATADEALVVVDNTPTQVAEAVISLLNQPVRRLHLGQRARSFMARYDWMTVARQMCELYGEVMQRREQTRD